MLIAELQIDMRLMPVVNTDSREAVNRRGTPLVV